MPVQAHERDWSPFPRRGEEITAIYQQHLPAQRVLQHTLEIGQLAKQVAQRKPTGGFGFERIDFANQPLHGGRRIGHWTSRITATPVMSSTSTAEPQMMRASRRS